MKVFLVDKYKVHIFSLPNKVEDSFTINYCSHNNVEEAITLSTDNNEWVISGTEELGIYDKNSMRLNSDHIQNNSIYNLKFIDLNDSLTMYCFETPMNYYSY